MKSGRLLAAVTSFGSGSNACWFLFSACTSFAAASFDLALAIISGFWRANLASAGSGSARYFPANTASISAMMSSAEFLPSLLSATCFRAPAMAPIGTAATAPRTAALPKSSLMALPSATFCMACSTTLCGASSITDSWSTSLATVLAPCFTYCVGDKTCRSPPVRPAIARSASASPSPTFLPTLAATLLTAPTASPANVSAAACVGVTSPCLADWLYAMSPADCAPSASTPAVIAAFSAAFVASGLRASAAVAAARPATPPASEGNTLCTPSSTAFAGLLA